MEDTGRESRLSMDEIYLQICRDLAKRTNCLRRQIGCLIVKNGQIVASGYNGAPKGLPLCSTKGCLRDELGIASGTQAEVCRGVHAEQNAIIGAGLDRASGATLYTNSFPCTVCAKLIIQAEIVRVVVGGGYPDREGIKLLKKAGIQVTIISDLE
ncbi:MAG TPA: cytidine/deoxycytidylate deaminase family protein [Bacillota bacterium]|nr:cytidine/deoxycytidylate deaminase family protein [Bacillota bacterium]